jgi:bla regulator protein blaR1
MLEGLWRATWQGSLLVGVIWLVTRYVPGIRPATRANLWWLATLKFLIAPAALFIPLAVLPFVPKTNLIEEPVPKLSRKLLRPMVGGEFREGSNQRALSVIRIEPIPWLLLVVGTVWGLGRWLQDFRRVRAWIRGGTWADDTPAGATMRILGLQMGLAVAPRLMVTPNVSSPMVVGPFRPIVLLPERWADEVGPDELPMLLAHELAHVRRRDLLLAFVPELAQIVFFFCPLAWFAKQRWATAREMACDAEAMAVTAATPQSYGRLLLKIVTRDHLGGISTAMGATSSYHTLKERFEMIQSPTCRPGRALKFVAMIAVVGCTALVLPWQLKAKVSPDEVKKLKAPALVNLKQLALGLVLYANDYDDAFPPAPCFGEGFCGDEAVSEVIRRDQVAESSRGQDLVQSIPGWSGFDFCSGSREYGDGV